MPARKGHSADKRPRSLDHVPYGHEGTGGLGAEGAYRGRLTEEQLSEVYKRGVLESQEHPRIKAHNVYDELTTRYRLSYTDAIRYIQNLARRREAQQKTMGRKALGGRETSFFRHWDAYMTRLAEKMGE
ncbi:MAG: hypothetical protein JXB14_06035 [Candidatus Altiarchaeota archaeon]|nr:hypothetical protein [Candidatus Altiarchaeota archaeon]